MVLFTISNNGGNEGANQVDIGDFWVFWSQIRIVLDVFPTQTSIKMGNFHSCVVTIRYTKAYIIYYELPFPILAIQKKKKLQPTTVYNNIFVSEQKWNKISANQTHHRWHETIIRPLVRYTYRHLGNMLSIKTAGCGSFPWRHSHKAHRVESEVSIRSERD